MVNIGNREKGLIYGAIIGDILGVPVEFCTKEELQQNPVVDMRSHEVHMQPKGTWSDDSSILLLSLDAATTNSEKQFEQNMMKNLSEYYNDFKFTPHGRIFDIGSGTRDAIENMLSGVPLFDCGSKDFNNLGNGSLFRVIPCTLGFDKDSTIIQHTSITHGHVTSQMRSLVFNEFIKQLLSGENKEIVFDNLKNYKLSQMDGVKDLFANDIKAEVVGSEGYVVATLIAGIHCLMTTESYKDCVLKAVNLGGDTDTNAFVAGALAGAYYGYESIPHKWIGSIASKENVDQIVTLFLKEHSKE